MIEHLGIVCRKKNVKNMVKLFKLLGYKLKHSGIVKPYGVKCLFFTSSKSNIEIELVYPVVKNSIISNYLEKHNCGLHHIACKVNDIKKFKDRLKPERIMGAKNNMFVTFLNPDKYGLLIELVEYKNN